MIIAYGLTDTGKATVAAILIGVGFLAFGGSTLLQGDGNRYRRKQSQLGHHYRNDILNFPDNRPDIKGPISNPGHIRAKRANEWTVSKPLLSLYLKPSGDKHSAIDNLRSSSKGLDTKSKNQGERLLSLRWKKRKSSSPKQFQKYGRPTSIYRRAFERFKNGFTGIQGYLNDAYVPKEGKRVRAKRDAPLRYNRDGTISLRCRFSPESCTDNNEATRRTRREGKRLWSLYLKPSGKKHSAIDNLREAFGVIPKRSTGVSRTEAKGERLLSVQWRKSPRPKPVQGPNNLYTRAFQRFSNDVIPSKRNRRIARPRPRAPVRGRGRGRGRRAPLRSVPRSAPRRVRQKWGFKRAGKGKEIFSLFLKPPQARSQGLRGGRHQKKSDLPLICRFQPKKCGAKGKKLFGIYYKGFRTLFPYALA